MIHIFIGRHSLYASLMNCLPLSCRLQTKRDLAANSYVLCPGQDIILYCKFIKETLQYRWCTIQGFIPPSALSAHTQTSLRAAGEGSQTVTITEF